MSTGPSNPGVGVKLYVPSAASVKVPWAELGPVTRLAVKAEPAVFLSFVKTPPETTAPAGVLAKSSFAVVLAAAEAGVTV